MERLDMVIVINIYIFDSYNLRLSVFAVKSIGITVYYTLFKEYFIAI